VGLVELRSPEQAKQAYLHKIVVGFWATASVVDSDGLDQSEVVVYPLVALLQGSA
jgi:hypothetical protein